MDLNVYDFLRNALAAVGLGPWAFNLVIALTKALIVLSFVLVNALFLIWWERKISGHIQQRLGPMRVGPHGTLQTFVDVLKLIAKEDIIPAKADRVIFALAPLVAFTPALAVFVVIPFGPTWVVRDLNIGLIFIGAITSVNVFTFILSGWGSNNKWALLSGMRSAAILISYEIPLVISVVSVALLTGSLSLQDMVRAQADGVWHIWLQPLGFLIFLVTSMAELNRAPFDLVEAESELVAGFNTEYSGLRWGYFFLTEFSNLFAVSAIAVTLYFGGWSGPAFLPPVLWFFLKTYAMVFLIMWIRWTMPRLRIDQLMDLGWKGLVPLSLVNLAATALYVLIA